MESDNGQPSPTRWKDYIIDALVITVTVLAVFIALYKLFNSE